MNTSRLKRLLAEYASLAIYTYLALFVLVLAGFALAFATGFKVDSSGGKLGVLGAAWVATKLTQPVRIMASVALVPIVARFFKIKKREIAPGGG
jgi:hypothetical protein